MSNKAEIKKQFVESIAKGTASLGFTQKPRNVISRPCPEGGILSVRFEFFGSAIIDVAAYVGVRCPSIEQRLSSMAFFEGWPAFMVKETVFQKIDTVVALITKQKIMSSANLPVQQEDMIVNVRKYIEEISSTFCDVNELANYCLSDTSLPIGHHAFRIPFILRDARMEDRCQSYMLEVGARGFINGYDRFIGEFNALR